MEEQLDQSAPPTNENLNAYLDDFYREEQETGYFLRACQPRRALRCAHHQCLPPRPGMT